MYNYQTKAVQLVIFAEALLYLQGQAIESLHKGSRLVSRSNELEINDLTAIDYVGKVFPNDIPTQLFLGGHHYLGAIHAYSHVRATHVELWFRETPDSPNKLVVDMEIDKFTGWKICIESLIPAQQ